MTTPASLGIDFGTTNTVISLCDQAGVARLARFAAPEGELFALRSALSFRAAEHGQTTGDIAAGPWAIEAYIEDPLETRFIQSFKTFAASASFSETQVQGRRYRFEDLLSTFLLKLKGYSGDQLAALPKRVIIGRPVTFAGGAPDETLALTRYEIAFQRLGFEEIRYAYEPVGAAFFFARDLTADATVLVGDFGGGTSDFSIIRFERSAGVLRAIPLGRSGVGVAGDAFDYRIIDNLVSPALGKGSTYDAFGKTLPIPSRYYSAFARWDQMALMRAGRDMREIRRLVRDAHEPEKIERLVEALDENYGYQLYRSVSRLKEALSSAEDATFAFQAGSIVIDRPVARSEFEGWITPELSQIDGAIDRALANANLAPADVDRVFLTGGTSLVPAVRGLFHRRFDAGRIETGAELESIATGLSLIGMEADVDRWTSRAAETPA